MTGNDFTPDAPGELVLNLDGQPAFLPTPLPPRLDLHPALVAAVGDVSNRLGRLDGTAATLPDPTILIRSFVRREAQLSSYIENTFADYDEVAAAEGGSERPAGAQARETLNAERAILFGYERVRDARAPLTNSLLREMHGILLDGVAPAASRGRFRACQVFIGNRELGIDAARFVPPPSHLLVDLMEDFEAFVLSREPMPPLIKLALLHYQFETIHPFEDGNGRLGRALILLGLCDADVLRLPVLNASLHFERNRQQYYDALLAVSTQGDWNGWLTFFLEGLRVAADESEQKLRQVLRLQRDAHEALRSARNSALLLTLLDHLFIRPVVTIPEVARLLGVTYPSARNNVDKLVHAGILEPVSGSSPARFVARDILVTLNPQPTRR